MCNKDDDNQTAVPDYTVSGFSSGSSEIEAVHAKYPELKALKLSTCVGANYNPTTNKICFHIPIYGDLCIDSPIKIPVGGDLKVCAETCGSFIPTGL